MIYDGETSARLELSISKGDYIDSIDQTLDRLTGRSVLSLRDNYALLGRYIKLSKIARGASLLNLKITKRGIRDRIVDLPHEFIIINTCAHAVITLARADWDSACATTLRYLLFRVSMLISRISRHCLRLPTVDARATFLYNIHLLRDA